MSLIQTALIMQSAPDKTFLTQLAIHRRLA